MSDTMEAKLVDKTELLEDAKDHFVEKTNTQGESKEKAAEPLAREEQEQQQEEENEEKEHHLEYNTGNITIATNNDNNKEEGKECVPTNDIAVIVDSANKGLVSATITDMNSNKTIATAESSTETVQTKDEAKQSPSDELKTVVESTPSLPVSAPVSETEPVNVSVNPTDEQQKEEVSVHSATKDDKSEEEKEHHQQQLSEEENTNINIDNNMNEQHNKDATTSTTSEPVKLKTEEEPEKHQHETENEKQEEKQQQDEKQTQEKLHSEEEHHEQQQHNETKLNANAKSFIPSLTNSPQLGASAVNVHAHNSNNNNNSFHLNRSHSGKSHTMSAPPAPLSLSAHHSHVGVTQIPLPRHARQKSPELHSSHTESKTHESVHGQPKTTEQETNTGLSTLATRQTNTITHPQPEEQQSAPTSTSVVNNNNNNNNTPLHTIIPQPFAPLTIHGLQAENHPRSHQQQQQLPPPPPPPVPLLPESNNNNVILSQSGFPVFVSNMPNTSSLTMTNAAAQSYPMLHPYVTALPTNTITNIPNVQLSQNATNNANSNPTTLTSTNNNNETGKIAFPPPIITGRPPSSSLPPTLTSPGPQLSQIAAAAASSSSSTTNNNPSSMPTGNTTSLNYMNLPQGDLLAPFAKAIPTLQSVMSAVQPLNTTTNNNNNNNNTLPPPPPQQPSLVNLPQPSLSSSTSVLPLQLPVSLQQHYTNVTQSLPTQLNSTSNNTNTNELLSNTMLMPLSAMNTISLQNYTPIPASTSTPASYQNMQNVNPQAMLSTTALPLPAFLTPFTSNTNMNTLPLPPPPSQVQTNANTHAPTSFSSASVSPSLPLFTSEVRQSSSQHLTQPSASVSTSSDPRLQTPQATFASNTMPQTLTHPLIGSQINYLPQQQYQIPPQQQGVNTTSFILSPQSTQMLTRTPAGNNTTTTTISAPGTMSGPVLSHNNLQQQQQQQQKQQMEQTVNNTLFPNNTMT